MRMDCIETRTHIKHTTFRTLLELPDGGLMCVKSTGRASTSEIFAKFAFILYSAVDFTSPVNEAINDETPIVIVLTGLTGG